MFIYAKVKNQFLCRVAVFGKRVSGGSVVIVCLLFRTGEPGKLPDGSEIVGPAGEKGRQGFPGERGRIGQSGSPGVVGEKGTRTVKDALNISRTP